EVALYDISTKLISIITQPVESINGAIFPKVSKELDMAFVKKVALFTLAVVLFILLGVQFFLREIFTFLNIIEVQHLDAIRLVLFSSIFSTLSVFLARNCFVVYNKFMLLFKSMVWSSVFYLGLILTLYFINLIVFNYVLLIVFL